MTIMDKYINSDEFIIAKKEITCLNQEKKKRSKELKVAYSEIAYLIEERGKRAGELAVANVELLFQNEEKEKRAAELLIANKELVFQNEEKEKRAIELILANSELKKAEANVRKLNIELEQKVIKRSAQYAFISQINQTIVHVKDADALFRKACSIALEFGRYKMAWIGSFDQEQNQITLLQSSGISKQSLKLLSNAKKQNPNPQNSVLSSGEYFLCNNIKQLPELESWIPFAENLNIGSFIILPIMKSGSLYGTFNLYADELNYFTADDIALLKEVTGDISFALDIFEKTKKHEEAEKALQKNFVEMEAATKEKSAILNTLPASIALLDNVGNIVKVNDNWIHFGQSNGLQDSYQHISKNYIDISNKSCGIDAIEGKQMSQGLGEILRGERDHFTLEYPCHSPTEKRWFKAEVRPIKNTLLPGAVVMHINITERKAAELERSKITSDLIQRNRDLEQFTYIISHNLRAPTANIIGLSKCLQDESLTLKERKEMMRGLASSATGLDTIIKDINSILQAKLELNEKKEIVSFYGLVTDITNSISKTIEQHNVRIVTDFLEVDEIFSLKVYMHSIFYNLISNSIKYRKLDEQPVIEISSKKESEKIMLSFKDNGLGIDLATKGDKVFGLYNRFHSHVEGKGMGLFMVKTQVEAIGGKISIKSEPNKGTEMVIVFEI